jgi:hypothetical protein
MDTKDQIHPSLPLQKGGITPLAKRGEGRFSEAYVFFIMDSLVNIPGTGKLIFNFFCFDMEQRIA